MKRDWIVADGVTALRLDGEAYQVMRRLMAAQSDLFGHVYDNVLSAEQCNDPVLVEKMLSVNALASRGADLARAAADEMDERERRGAAE